VAFGVREMNFHDFHLKGYSVLDSGQKIVLDLLYDYPDARKEKSKIEFHGVVCYHFNHTACAIITDIEEVNVEELVKEESGLLESFAHNHGLTLCEPPRDSRRLHHLRGWGHEYEEAIFTRGKGASGSIGG
jgi:hypothetical protein